MPTALEELRARNRTDLTLPSGLQVTIRLPRIRDCIIAGDVPLPVLAKLDVPVTGDEVPDLTPEELRGIATFNDTLVVMAVVAIEGDPVQLVPADVSEFEEEDYNALVSYASRATPLPGKA